MGSYISLVWETDDISKSSPAFFCVCAHNMVLLHIQQGNNSFCGKRILHISEVKVTFCLAPCRTMEVCPML